MFNINTFIKRPGVQISNFNDVYEKPNKYFVDSANVIEVEEYKQEIDCDYISGVITIEYDNHFLMDFSLWDLIDQLWSYIIQLVEDVIYPGYGKTYSLDQPLKMEMKVISQDLILFSLNDGKIVKETLPKQTFLNALLKGAESFFTNLINYCDNEIVFREELDRIKSIIKQLN